MNKNNSITFKISGMHCASCAINCQRQLKKVKGVTNAEVSYAAEEASVEFDPKQTKLVDLKKSVESLGYAAHLPDNGVLHSSHHVHEHDITNLSMLQLKLIFSIVLTFPLLLAMLPGMPMWLADPGYQLLLATPVQFWIGWQFYVSAWRALKNGMTNMDTLIVLGTSVAYFFSLAVIFFGAELVKLGIEASTYFETSAAIITLILLGKFLEARAKEHTSDAIKKLLDLQVKKARVVRNGMEMEVSVEEVVVGNLLKVKPGEKIPVDGVIQDGSAAIDESMVTGESMPTTKHKGNNVIGATLNTNSVLLIRATKVGSDTFLAQVVELVKRAQTSKAPIQKLVDKVSSIFVPSVIVLSLIAFVLWLLIGPAPVLVHALLSMIAVLIIACPCALGLATPTSIMVGVGRGAGEGILIKDAEHLEIAGKISTVVFDKTGTLTEGKPEFQTIVFAKSVSDVEALKTLIYSIESMSHHPLAEAVVNKLKEGRRAYEVHNFEDLSGKGVKGVVNGQELLIGTLKLLLEHGVSEDTELEKVASELSEKAQTVSHVAIGNKHLAVIGIADTIKSSSKQVVETLHKLGIQTVMLSGDNQKTAEAVAKQIGIDEVRAQVLPSDKHDVINELKKQGEVVAMVGDGINDAPALATADIGIAMGMGTDIAIEAAGVTLLRSDISLVPKAIQLSKATLKNIQQNLFWAFGYNVLLIPVAMGVLYPFFKIQLNPVLASAAMAFSSVSVVTNALRLKKVKI